MSLAQAKNRCPNLVIVEPHFQNIKRSHNKFIYFHKYTDLVEPISLDEAFLDVTYNKYGIDLAVDLAKRIKEDIYRETNFNSFCRYQL